MGIHIKAKRGPHILNQAKYRLRAYKSYHFRVRVREFLLGTQFIRNDRDVRQKRLIISLLFNLDMNEVLENI